MIELVSNGQVLAGFSSVSVSRSLDQFCGTYSLNVFRGQDQNKEFGAWLPTFPEDEILIKCDGETVIDGFNDECVPSFSSSGISFGVNGREKNKDIVDCPSSQTLFENKKVDEIARLVCAEFGVNFLGASGVDVGAPLTKFSADPGKSAYETILAACKQRRVLPVSDGLGNVRLENGNYKSAAVDLAQGVNVLGARGRFSTKERYRSYRVVASNDYSGKTFAEVIDDDGARSRRWVMVDEKWSTKECCQDRAMWEAKHRHAIANALSVTVSGWRQAENGEIWKPGLIVNCDIPCILGNASEYLVNKVTLGFAEGSGSSTVLELIDPNAYSPAPTFPEAKKKLKATKTKPDVWDPVRRQTGSKLK